MVSVQKGFRTVPHCVVPPVHWKRHVPWLQMVMAEGSVGQAFPQEPLHIRKSRSEPRHAFGLCSPGSRQLSLQQRYPLAASGDGQRVNGAGVPAENQSHSTAQLSGSHTSRVYQSWLTNSAQHADFACCIARPLLNLKRQHLHWPVRSHQNHTHLLHPDLRNTCYRCHTNGARPVRVRTN